MQGIPVQLSRSSLVVVPSPSPKLDNVLLSVVQEIRFPVYVLSAAKTECHKSVSRAGGEIRDHWRFHEAFWGLSTLVGFC